MEIVNLGQPEPEHNLNDAEQAIGLRLMAWRETMPGCPTCTIRSLPIMMPGDGWGLDIFHEDHCPEHEDNQDAIEVEIVGLDRLAMHGVAEEIWSATTDHGHDDGRGTE